MENFFGRYRNAATLLAVLLVQVLALATQVKRPVIDPGTAEARPSRLIRVWAVTILYPFEKVMVSAGAGVRHTWANYLDLRGVRRQNQELQTELERSRIEQVRLGEDARQAHRLQGLLAFKEQFISRTEAAQVIGTGGTEQSRTIYIDKGAQAGVGRDMAVITADGVVGKVVRVFANSAQVLLINDQSSGMGVILEKTRLQGILKGTAAGLTEVRYVMGDEKVEPGERVLTSGGDGVYPKGLPVGTVRSVAPDKENDPFLSIKVMPSVNLSKLEEVLVITQSAERSPAEDGATSAARAADVLGERLPGVKSTQSIGTAVGTKLGDASMTPSPASPAVPAMTPAQAAENLRLLRIRDRFTPPESKRSPKTEATAPQAAAPGLEGAGSVSGKRNAEGEKVAREAKAPAAKAPAAKTGDAKPETNAKVPR